jgi:hypothetical protein
MNDFTKELLALLEKHDASIAWGCHFASDLHGVWGEHMTVTNRKNETLLKLDGAEISAHEIKGQS